MMLVSLKGLRPLLQFGWYRVAALMAVAVVLGCAAALPHDDKLNRNLVIGDAVGSLVWRPAVLSAKVADILEAADRSGGRSENLKILHPFDEALFPRDLAAPDILWQDEGRGDGPWLVRIQFADTAGEIHVLCGRPRWRPSESLWETIKRHSLDSPAKLTVYAPTEDSGAVAGRKTITFGTSSDPVGAPVFFQQIPLPFAHARDNKREFRWLMADLTRPEPARQVMQNPPACAFCHSFSADGSTFGLDMDYRGDKGGYLISSLDKRPRLSPQDLISWNDLPVLPGIPNMGLFAKLSPTGRYIMATVGEKPFMAIFDQVDFSQLFFPITGKLAWYDHDEKSVRLLPGADDDRFVQTSPAWSPDGKNIYFARAPVDRYLERVMGSRRLLPVAPETDIHALNANYRIQYDIFRVPFAGGRGGEPMPLEGASGNGRSNYFPRVSPDGRWVVFTQAATGMVAQPDSRLMIVPANGGAARVMRCNTAYYNSWHSWSPNGRWIVFVSKVNTPYTELFLAHVAPDGSDRPPVWLSRLSHPRRAALLPEFVNRRPDDFPAMGFAFD